MENPFRVLPSVDELAERLASADGTIAPATARAVIRWELGRWRDEIAAGARPSREAVVAAIAQEIQSLGRRSLEPVINATGVLLHTNLGRAAVSPETADAMREAAASAVPLELDPGSNQRGGRMADVSRLMRALTGAEATLVVNNNAAAVLLALSALAAGRSVVVSRGEAIEIGGGFRIPDVLRQSGARLVEVGTTNRTYLRDYEAAIEPDTAALLKVHTSNFRVSGFVSSVPIAELTQLGNRTDLPVIEDLGSGSILQPGAFGLASEPTIGEQIEAGADVVTASGDKLLGGPQAGLIVGRADLLAQIERHPLARAVRADKTCLAGVAETLRHYLRGDAVERIPIWRMIAARVDALRARADAAERALAPLGCEAAVIETRSAVGGGSLPGQDLPSFALALVAPSADGLARRLRLGRPAVYGRIADGRVLLDVRTVLPEDDELLIRAVSTAITEELG